MKKLLFSHPNYLMSDEEKMKIKEWVKENFIPNGLPNAFWHPYVKTTWNKYQKRHLLNEEISKLDRSSAIDNSK